jgi:hypothetical protein
MKLEFHGRKSFFCPPQCTDCKPIFASIGWCFFSSEWDGFVFSAIFYSKQMWMESWVRMCMLQQLFAYIFDLWTAK